MYIRRCLMVLKKRHFVIVLYIYNYRYLLLIKELNILYAQFGILKFVNL